MSFTEAEELYKVCCEYYKYVEDMSDDLDITFDEVDEIFTTLLSDVMLCMYEGKEEIINGIKFYKEIFDRQKNVTTYQELIDIIKFQHIDNKNSPHQILTHNIVIFCMKITTHLTWSLCYDLAPRLHPTPELAVMDIINPLEASQREFRKILKFLSNE